MKKTRIQYIKTSNNTYTSEQLFCVDKIIYAVIDLNGMVWRIEDVEGNVLYEEKGNHFRHMLRNVKRFLKKMGANFYDEIKRKSSKRS